MSRPDDTPRPPPEPSLAHLAATTPARDWARGKLTGGLDWKRVIARSDLPEPLARLVTDVVVRSRLWRSERAELAGELCAHFVDGLAAGKTKEQLMHDFGDPKKASALIRRAKKRGRHWTYRAFVHTVQGLGAVLLAGFVLYAVLVWRFYTGEPTVARNFAAEYNETIEAIPEDDRAWPMYMKTYAMLEDLSPQAFAQNAWPDLAPEHPLYPEALAYLHRQEGVLALVHRAADKPALGAVLSDVIDPAMVETYQARNPEMVVNIGIPSENPLLMQVLLPELGHMRALARLLTFDAHVAARAGESERVLRDIRSLIGLAEHCNDRPILIGSLVALAIDALTINTTAGIIDEFPDLFTDEQLRELAHRHAGFMDGDPHVDLTGERWFFEDVVQRTYTDDGHGDGHATAEGLRVLSGLSADEYELTEHWNPGAVLAAPVAASLMAGRADLMAKYNELMAQMEHLAALPMWEYDDMGSPDAEIGRIKADPILKIRYSPITMLLPAMNRAAQAAEAVIQRRDGLLTGIALELYKRDHGEYPQTLDELVPAFLPAVRPDRYTGEAMHYALSDGQPRLWSVGVDRNDDGGRYPVDRHRAEIYHWLPAQEAAVRERTEPAVYDGDWILWPIVYEPSTGQDEE